jgi:glycopeptide antibiotics resistance protein
MTLLVGLVIMDDLFELDDVLVITLKKPKLKIEIRKYLIWAFLIVCTISIVLEVVQFLLSSSNTSWLDPLAATAGSMFGIILHIIGSKWLMKRVEFELDRWESNVL